MWFKKKSVLQADHHYDTEKSFDGTDWRTDGGSNTWSASQTPPSAADANKYFYLPALGYYYSGQLDGVGSGYYWSSSALYSDNAYYLFFSSGYVSIDSGGRDNGYRVGGFE